MNFYTFYLVFYSGYIVTVNCKMVALPESIMRQNNDASALEFKFKSVYQKLKTLEYVYIQSFFSM